MKGLRFSWKYALTIAGVAVIGYLVMVFNSRAIELRRLAMQRDAAAARATGVARENASLQTQIAGATSEALVIEWAYEKGHMKKPGDIPVVPLAPGGGTPAPTPTPGPRQLPVQNWQMWMLLFVDSISP
jgi:hypothetical protein